MSNYGKPTDEWTDEQLDTIDAESAERAKKLDSPGLFTGASQLWKAPYSLGSKVVAGTEPIWNLPAKANSAAAGFLFNMTPGAYDSPEAQDLLQRREAWSKDLMADNRAWASKYIRQAESTYTGKAGEGTRVVAGAFDFLGTAVLGYGTGGTLGSALLTGSTVAGQTETHLADQGVEKNIARQAGETAGVFAGGMVTLPFAGFSQNLMADYVLSTALGVGTGALNRAAIASDLEESNPEIAKQYQWNDPTAAGIDFLVTSLLYGAHAMTAMPKPAIGPQDARFNYADGDTIDMSLGPDGAWHATPEGRADATNHALVVKANEQANSVQGAKVSSPADTKATRKNKQSGIEAILADEAPPEPKPIASKWEDIADPAQEAQIAEVTGAVAKDIGLGEVTGNTVPHSITIAPKADHPKQVRDEALHGAIEKVETNGKPRAVSPVGALGPMQTMPATLVDPGYGVRPANAETQAEVKAGGRLSDAALAELRRVGQDYADAMIAKYGLEGGLAAYNWGPGNWEKALSKYGGNVDKALASSNAETRAYVPKVLREYFKADPSRADVVAIAKPLAMNAGKVDDIRAWLRENGGTITQEWTGVVDTMRIAEHYKQMREKEFYGDMMRYWSGREATAFRVSVPKNKIAELRALLGSAKPEPGTFRDRTFGALIPANKALYNVQDNGIHLSDSAEEGAREAAVWFAPPRIKSDRPETLAAHEYLWNELTRVVPDTQFSGSLYSGLAIKTKLDDLDYRLMTDDIDATVAEVEKIPGVFVDREGIDATSGERYVKLEYEWPGGKADIAIVPRNAYRYKIAPSTMAHYMPAEWIAGQQGLKTEKYGAVVEARNKYGKESPEYEAAKQEYEAVKEAANTEVRKYFGISKDLWLTPKPGEPISMQSLALADQHQAARLLVSEQLKMTPEEMYAKAVENQRVLVEALKELGLAMHLSPEIAMGKSKYGEKNKDSFMKKAGRRAGLHGLITDAVRATVTANSVAESDAIVMAIAKKFDVLDDGFVTYPQGYMDRKLNFRFADGGVGEIQIMAPEVYIAKEEKGGHELYDRLEKESANLTAEEIRDLTIKSQDIYQAAIDEADPSFKAVHGMSSREGYISFKDAIANRFPPSTSRTADSVDLTQAGADAPGSATSMNTLEPSLTAQSSPSNLINSAPLDGGNGNSVSGSNGTTAGLGISGSSPGPMPGNESIPQNAPARIALDENMFPVQGNETTVLTERGMALNVRYVVVEADSLVTSHDDVLNVNPDFPAELQPRDRGRAASEEQISRIANDLKPEFLGESYKAGDGAPIVGKDGVVESGNARTIALRRAYGNGKAGRYVEYLKANAVRFGLDPAALEGMKRPVLARVATGNYDRAEFARQANESTVAAMSVTEQAMSDAGKLPDMTGLVLNDDGSINMRASGAFVRSFIEGVGPNERATMITADAQLSQQGANRIRNAVFAAAYGDPELVSMMAETTDANVKNLLAGMLRAAAPMAQLRSFQADGARHGPDITPDLVAAARKFSQLRADGYTVQEWKAQGALFGDGLSETAMELLDVIGENARAPKRMAEFLGRYVDAVHAMGDPRQADMLGGNPTDTRSAIQTARGITDAANKPPEMERLFNQQLAMFDDQGVPYKPMKEEYRLPTQGELQFEKVTDNENAQKESPEGWRADYTPAVVEKAYDSLDALMRRYSGSVLYRRIRESIGRTKTNLLIGQTVNSHEDMGLLLEMYTNPYFETARYIFLDENGAIVGETAISQRTPNQSVALPSNLGSVSDIAYWLRGLADSFGAKGMYISHNHPSGDPTPSHTDYLFTNQVKRAALHVGIDYKGHIVTNHKRYHYIDSSNAEVTRDYSNGEVDPRLDSSGAYDDKISEDTLVNQIRKISGGDIARGEVVLMIYNARGKLNAAMRVKTEKAKTMLAAAPALIRRTGGLALAVGGDIADISGLMTGKTYPFHYAIYKMRESDKYTVMSRQVSRAFMEVTHVPYPTKMIKQNRGIIRQNIEGMDPMPERDAILEAAEADPNLEVRFGADADGNPIETIGEAVDVIDKQYQQGNAAADRLTEYAKTVIQNQASGLFGPGGKKPSRADQAASNTIAAKYRDLMKHDKDFPEMDVYERMMYAAEKAAEDARHKAFKQTQRRYSNLLKQLSNSRALRPRAIELGGTQPWHDALFERMHHIDMRIRGQQGAARADMLDLLEAIEPKFLGVIQNQENLLAFAKEVLGENSDNPTMKRLAAGYTKAMDELRVMANSKGADIGKLDYGWLPHYWDNARVGKAGQEEYVNDMMQFTDLAALKNDDGTVMDNGEARAFYAAAWETLFSEGRNKGITGAARGNRASKHDDAHRVIHFKDAESYMAAMAKYGQGDLLEAIMRHVDTMAKDIAIMDEFGSSPGATYELLKAQVERGDNAFGKHSQFATLDMVWQTLNGETGAPVSERLGRNFQAVRNWVTATALQAVMLSSITDAPLQMLVAKSYGMDIGKNMGNTLASFKGDVARDAAKMGIATEYMLGEIALWSQDNLVAKKTGKLAEATMRLTGVNRWTYALRRGAELTMAMTLPEQLTKAWDDLGPRDRENLKQAGITARDWKIWQDAGVGMYRDQAILMASDIAKISPDSAARYLGYLDDIGKTAVYGPDVRIRAAITQGAKAGTWGGELTRSLMLFKSFALGMPLRHLRRLKRMDNMSRVQYATLMALGLALFGAMALQLKQLANGKDPKDMTEPKFWAAAWAQGGGLGIFYDVIYGGFDAESRTGRSNYRTLTGPVFGRLADIMEMGYEATLLAGGDMTKEKQLRQHAARFVTDNIPLSRIWWYKQAVDQVVGNDMREAISPGYAAKERARAAKYDESYYIKPGFDVREPDMEKAVGE